MDELADFPPDGPRAAAQTVTCLDCGAEIDSLFAYQYATLAGFGRRPVCESCYTRVVTGAAVRSLSS
jgi:RNase P subunit RPR2